jgi:DNA-binding NtrC family response regulator
MNQAEQVLLVLDDDESIRLSLSAFFEDRGWMVRTCASGEDALEELQRYSAHAAIVDVRMNGMTGDAFIRQAMRLSPNLVFLLFTGSLDYSIPKDLMHSPSVGNTVFHKPILKMDELGAALELLLKKNKTS